MSVIRIKKDQNYFAASNVPFNDEQLSWEARGVMGYLLSKPNNWEVRFNDLVQKGPAGAHKIRGILKELQKHGYLERKRIQTAEGQFDWVSTVYEIPTISRKSIDGDDSTISRLSIDGKPRDILSTELISTNNGAKNAPRRDTRLDHPALQVYHANATLHVPKNWRDEVIATVTDYEKWAKVIRDWMGKGWHKGNIQGMLDVYRNGAGQKRKVQPTQVKRQSDEETRETYKLLMGYYPEEHKGKKA